jgi:hypothetical protein
MNKNEREEVAYYRRRAKSDGITQYRFAWILIEKFPNLAVAIIRDYIKKIDKEEKQ